MMPTQYPYPETDWATGTMRKTNEALKGDVGDAAGRMSDHPMIETMERLHKSRKEAQGDYKSLTPEQWANWQQQFPQAQIIDAEHPQLPELGKTHDFYTIPNQYEKFLFMNPKQQQQTTGPVGGG